MARTTMGTIYWDGSQGGIRFSKHFDENDTVLTMDAIMDWIAVLHAKYEEEYTRSIANFEAARANAAKARKA